MNMNALEIKEKRKKLNLTQKQLAERIGVSTQTINGYENGKEIPSTKIQILESVLNENQYNIVSEPTTLYNKSNGFKSKINDVENQIYEIEKNILIKKELKEDFSGDQTIIKILKERIELIKIGERNKRDDI
jgi:transcriptional regulator with XRE-family HTH domain